MNNIQEKQNSTEILEALYAQTKLYTEVKNIRRFNIIIILINCICMKFLEINEVEQKYALIVVGIFIISSFFIEKITNEKSSLAAEIQEYVDRKLFGFKFTQNRIENYSIKEIKQKILEIVDANKDDCYEKINLNGNGKVKGVKDWYNEIPENLSRNEAIFKCQSQNIWWEEEMSRWYLNFLKINIIVVSAFIAIFLRKYLIPCILMLTELLSYFFIRFKNYKEYTNIMKDIKAIKEHIENTNLKNIKGLEDLQEKIYKRRKADFKVPDWVHKLKSAKLHIKYKKIFGGKK